ncbi:unnamed protein product [Paramecium primaurelia]|uniref:Transmembrane protein n=1 Tax=Paramecium primaurelia TaxID=5886 RepID=A0A8S1M3Q3_PARPR|nr:unnamed protein product [Paramecium primaurelia]
MSQSDFQEKDYKHLMIIQNQQNIQHYIQSRKLKYADAKGNTIDGHDIEKFNLLDIGKVHKKHFKIDNYNHQMMKFLKLQDMLLLELTSRSSKSIKEKRNLLVLRMVFISFILSLDILLEMSQVIMKNIWISLNFLLMNFLLLNII